MAAFRALERLGLLFVAIIEQALRQRAQREGTKG
jgi:hypothetical protein